MVTIADARVQLRVASKQARERAMTLDELAFPKSEPDASRENGEERIAYLKQQIDDSRKEGGDGEFEREARANIDDILADITVLRHRMDDLLSDYEEVIYRYNEGVGEGWLEDDRAKSVARNAVDLYRLMQDQHGNLLAARDEMRAVGKAVAMASSSPQFEVVFPGKVDPQHPFASGTDDLMYVAEHTASPRVEVDVYGEAAEELYRRALDLPASVTSLYADVRSALLELNHPVLAAELKTRYARLVRVMTVDIDDSDRRPLYNKPLDKVAYASAVRDEDEEAPATSASPLRAPPFVRPEFATPAPPRAAAAAAAAEAGNGVNGVNGRADQAGGSGKGKKKGKSGKRFGDMLSDAQEKNRQLERKLNYAELMSLYARLPPENEGMFKTMVEKDKAMIKGIVEHAENKKLIEEIKAAPELVRDGNDFMEFYAALIDSYQSLGMLGQYMGARELRASSKQEAPDGYVRILVLIKRVKDGIPRYVPFANHEEAGLPFTNEKAYKMVVAMVSPDAAPDGPGKNGVPITTTRLPAPDVDRGVFTRMLEMYRNAKPEEKRKAGERIVDLVDTTASLNREAVLRLTLVDRLIFVVVSLVVRVAALRGVALLVNRGVLRSLRGAIITYALLYSLLVMLLVGAVTLDDGVLRIAFNYLNPHAHLNSVVLHLMVLWMLVLVVVSVLMAEYSTLATGGSKWGASVAPIVLSTADRADVVSNLTSISFFAWMVTTFQVVAPL